MQIKLTQSLAERVPSPAKGKSVLYADPEIRGFYLIVTPTKRAYYVQSMVNGRQVRAKIGDHPMMDAKEARDAARRILVNMRSGTNPNEEKRKARAQGITLRQALELHLSAKPLSSRTKEDYDYYCKQYLSDWLDKPLAELGADRAAVRERHVRITEKNGATSADSSFRIFRAIYNRGLREHPDLPANPTANVDYHGQRRRKVDANADKLGTWGKAVIALGSPVRRDFHLFMLLTGMRRTAACESSIQDLNDLRNVLHVPRPKGGAARAFNLPLSGPLHDLVAFRVAQNEKMYRRSPWLFPADSRSGHVAEVQQHELGDLTGHALRHAYATLALEAGVPIAELRFLLNHSASSGGVTMGYLNPSIEHLRSYQDKASGRILEALGLIWTPGEWPPQAKE